MAHSHSLYYTLIYSLFNAAVSNLKSTKQYKITQYDNLEDHNLNNCENLKTDKDVTLF
jgi:hypothetical protein